MVHVSVKVVVGALLLVTAASVVVSITLPIIHRMQSEAFDFVTDACRGVAVFLQQDFDTWRHRAELACDTVRRAALTRDMLAPGYDVWDFGEWAATVIINLGTVDILLGTADGYGVRIATYGFDLIDNTSAKYGYLVNYTAPGQFLDYGLFRLKAPHLAGNASQPWHRFASVPKWTDVPWGQALLNLSYPSPSSKMRWAPVTPSPIDTANGIAAETVMVFGGSVTTTSNRTQFVSLTVRGGFASQYFNTLPDPTASIIGLMFETATSTFMAGNIADPTGRREPDGTTRPVYLRDLQDPRVRPLLSGFISTPDGVVSSVDAFSTCVMPCSFVYWTGSNVFSIDPPTVFGVFRQDFIAIRVVPARSAAPEARFVVLQPSSNVVSNYLARFKDSTWGLGVIVSLCVAAVIAVWCIFRSLGALEEDVLNFAKAITAPPHSHDAHFRLRRITSVVRDFDRLFRCLNKLSQEVLIMRAFSSSAIYRSVDDGVAEPVDSSGGSHSHDGPHQSAPASRRAWDTVHLSSLAAPNGKLWVAPVTSVTARVAPEYLLGQTCDPVDIHRRHTNVFDIIHKHITNESGAEISAFYGDKVFMHFNARGRTRNHALVAVHTCIRCADDINTMALSASRNDLQGHQVPPIAFGVATSTATCGPIGPSHFQNFSIIGPALSQSSAMCNVAASWRQAIVATCHVKELVVQAYTLQPKRLNGVSPCTFVGAARMVLSGEPTLGPSTVYVVRF